MQLNPDKCKELRISFNAKPRSFDPIVLNGKELEVVTNFKLLGVNIHNKLTWNHHIDDVVKKFNKRLFPEAVKACESSVQKFGNILYLVY